MSLEECLLPNAEQSIVEIEAFEENTITEILEGIGLPRESIKLVLFVDGVHQWIDELH
uniref:Uncharacterized protein n=1 Tax=Candidatus Kentrum sp. SD TaxID=2126332 RepID=A0A450YAS9_9GAMM|nr:MAG: hypothetical protein BECKSD772F_GA0070984_102617 [Candidatus Kentron sp. SD]